MDPPPIPSMGQPRRRPIRLPCPLCAGGPGRSRCRFANTNGRVWHRSAGVKITIPELALVVLIGPSGCGKSTLARKHFKSTETLSSDFCRGLVSDDENNQAATTD